MNIDELSPELQELIQFGNLAKKVLGNKNTKTSFEKLVKQVAPEIETSEDLAEPIVAPLREEISSIKTQLKGILDGAAAYSEEQRFTTLRNAGYTDDGIEKIKGIMKERDLKDPEAAAALFDKLNLPAPARVAGVSPQNFGNDIFGIAEGEKAKERLQLLFDNHAFIETVREVAAEFNNQ